MNHADEPAPQPGPARKWDWSNPQIVLNVVAIAVGLAGSIFGVALAAPFGQDLLCKTMGLSCPRTSFENVKLSVNVIEFDKWCDSWLAEMAREEFPPPGYTGSRADCSLDFSSSEPAGYGGGIAFANIRAGEKDVVEENPGGVMSNSGLLLVGHLTMEHPPPRDDTSFTLRAQCTRRDPGGGYFQRVPCELGPTSYSNGMLIPEADDLLRRQFDSELAGQDLPEGGVRGVMRKGEVDYIARWRLDIDGQTNALLPLGEYRVEIIIGAPGEPVEPKRIGASFEVYGAPA